MMYRMIVTMGLGLFVVLSAYHPIHHPISYSCPLAAEVGTSGGGGSGGLLTIDWSQFTPMAVLAFVIVVFVWRTLPEHSRAMVDISVKFSETLEYQRKDFMEALERMCQRSNAAQDRASDILKELLENCAVAREQFRECAAYKREDRLPGK